MCCLALLNHQNIPKSLHYGCGDVSIPNFLNVDLRSTSATDLVTSHTALLKDFTGYFDTIYLCHVLEHFPLHEVQSTLRVFHNLLNVTGKIYISVPDFEILSSIYLARRVTLDYIVRAIHGGQEYPENTHYVSFDAAFLTNFLASVGFHSITRYLPGDFLPHDVVDTSTYEIGDKQISLNICATK